MTMKMKNKSGWDDTCNCGTKKSYSEKYDAYYCKRCKKWLEVNCEHPDCAFCKNRPITPEEIPNEN